MRFWLLVPLVLLTLVGHPVQAQVPGAGLILDLRSDSGLTISAEHVVRWEDLSGNGNDAQQTNELAQPTLATFAGHRGVSFPGWCSLRCPSVFPTHSDYTLIVVAHSTNVTAMTNFVSGETHALWLFSNPFPRVLHGNVFAQSVCETPIRSDSINVISVRFSDLTGQAKVTVNDGREDSSYVGINTDSTVYIGAFNGGYMMQGEIFRVLLYQREISKSELESMQNRLLQEYGVRQADPPTALDTTFVIVPRRLQLYQRGQDDSASVAIDGAFAAPGFDSIAVSVHKNGAPLGRTAERLTYVNGKAKFSFRPRIAAELSEYTFDISAIRRDRDSLLRRVDSVTCGDAFLIDGQSNATFGYNDSTYSNEYVRTFGLNLSHNLRDTLWTLATADKWGDGPSISGWGQRIARDIVEQEHVPALCINAGVSGTNIQSHRPDSANRLDLQSIYGRMLYRIRESGLDTAIRYLVWDQGELNYADQYHEYFTEMRDAWHTDMPRLQKIYVLQNRPNFCGWGNIDLRNVQWHLQDSFPDVETMATAALPFQDGCHYYDDGQNAKGDRIFHSIARDFYNATDTVGLRCAFLKSVRYANAENTRIIAHFESGSPLHSTHDTTVSGVIETLQDNLYLNDSTQIVSVQFSGSELTLELSRPSHASTLTYLADQYYRHTNDIYEGPWIVNEQGIGALLFYEFPVTGFQDVQGSRSTTLKVWPDPADRSVNLSRSDTMNGVVEVLSLNGSRVLSRPWTAAEPNSLMLDVHSLPSGSYVVRYVTRDSTTTARFVIRP